jgi:hypothetical protein
MSSYGPYAGSARYRLSNVPAQAGVTGGLDSVHAPGPHGDSTKFLSLNNPVTVLVGIAGIALGFMAFGTSIRVGNSSAALSLGKA